MGPMKVTSKAKSSNFRMSLSEEAIMPRGLRVDTAAGIIYGVKILGLNSVNGRKYLPEAVKSARRMYEGVRVNIDHPKENPEDQRSAYDRIGKLINVQYVEGKGLYGDLVLLTEHPMTPRILEAAQKMPEVYGLSHNAQGDGHRDLEGTFIVSEIVDVRHVDLVADPATTKSLAESVDNNGAKLMSLKEKIAEACGDESIAEKVIGLVESYMAKTTKEGELVIKHEDDDKEKGKDMDSEECKEGDPGYKDTEFPGIKKAKLRGKTAKIEGDGEDDCDESDDESDEDEMEGKSPDWDYEKTKEGAEVKKLSDQLKALQEEIAKTKREAEVRSLCESVSLPADKELLADLMAMPSDSATRHIKRLAEAHKAVKPRTMMPVMEGKEGKFPEGLDLGNFLTN